MNKYSIAVLLAVTSFAANANVIRTLDGTTYEFLDLSATQEMVRAQVEAGILDSSSSLYGYEYASRERVEQLLLSYAAWDGVSGYHGDPTVVSGVVALMTDFGETGGGDPNGGGVQLDTVDGYSFNANYSRRTHVIFGSNGECGVNASCESTMVIWYDFEGNALAANQNVISGWDHAYASPNTYQHELDAYGPYAPSLLVRTVVPIPAAAWLFGSALAGLGFLRGKRR